MSSAIQTAESAVRQTLDYNHFFPEAYYKQTIWPIVTAGTCRQEPPVDSSGAIDQRDARTLTMKSRRTSSPCSSSYCWIAVSDLGGFSVTCFGVGNCERSHPPPRASTNATA